MKQPVKNIDPLKDIFAVQPHNFNDTALAVFQFQYQNNTVYRLYCNAVNIQPAAVTQVEQIPFLPIQFFKTHTITTTNFHPQAVFKSSGTTGLVNSMHYIKDIDVYKQSFVKAFSHFYGPALNKCILGLLPSYLENGDSSLVYMTDALIKQSQHPLSGFYLYDFEKLHNTLLHNEILNQPTLLIGVTYALLDFAEKFPIKLRNTIVMETGGMKGRRQELTRQQIHQLLQKNLGVPLVHSEYGMTELLSQAYSKGDGVFHCPQWMKILIREEDDPFAIVNATETQPKAITGCINIIDLANLYSCSFIATEDIGRLHHNGSFEVLGRIDTSDIRGCSLLAL